VKVGDSVKYAIDAWDRDEDESAMLHACNAVDGTSAKRYPPPVGVARRFTTLLRDHHDIFGAWAAPGINIVDTRWPVDIKHAPMTSDRRPDLADVIYGIHRCAHGHGDELPNGFALLPLGPKDETGRLQAADMAIEDGRIALSRLTIWALIMVAVAAPENVDQSLPDSYHFVWLGQRYRLQSVWGRADDLRTLIATASMPSVVLDFGDWTRPQR
jgi:hypothetical protein